MSPSLFDIALIPLFVLLRDMKEGYILGESWGKINHLLFSGDLKFCCKAMRECDSLVQTVSIFSSDTGIQFEIIKCAVLGKRKQDE